jgi:hypothetical protein
MQQLTQMPPFLELLAKRLGVQNAQGSFKPLAKRRGGRRNGAGRKPKTHGGWRRGPAVSLNCSRLTFGMPLLAYWRTSTSKSL